MQFTRRAWLQSAFASATACALPARAAQKQRPNIVLIVADDLGYGDLGCYGQQQITTPHLDRMAAEGLRFTQAYAGSTVCAPSRCCLMTGLHTGHAWVRGNDRIPLRPEDVTLAEVLKHAGYRTGLVGKWGLGNEGTTGHPNKQGFDYFFGYLDQMHAHNYFPEFLWRNEEKVPLEGNVEVKPQVSSERTQYTPDLVTREALQFLKGGEQPYFLYLTHTLPHANNELGRETGDGMEILSHGAYAEKEWPAPQKGHAAMISKLDEEVGKVLEHLRATGQAENTIVFFTSDNGSLNEGGGDYRFFNSSGGLRGHKRDLYEGGIRVPLIVWGAGIQTGKTTDHVCANWDLLPTLAELGGVAAPVGLDGIPITATLTGRGRQETHPHLYWEFHEKTFSQAVRVGDWKAVKNGEAATELFDVETDIGEQTNVAGAHPEVVAKAEALFQSVRVANPNWQTPGEVAAGG